MIVAFVASVVVWRPAITLHTPPRCRPVLQLDGDSSTPPLGDDDNLHRCAR